MQQIVPEEKQTWESILYDRSYDPFPDKIFKNFDESFIRGLPYLGNDYIKKYYLKGRDEIDCIKITNPFIESSTFANAAIEKIKIKFCLPFYRL